MCLPISAFPLAALPCALLPSAGSQLLDHGGRLGEQRGPGPSEHCTPT